MSSVITKPGAPPLVTLNEVSLDEIDFSWEEPENTGGDTELHYQIEIDEIGNGSYSILSEQVMQTSFLVTDLTTNTLYNFRIRSVNSAGISDESLDF